MKSCQIAFPFSFRADCALSRRPEYSETGRLLETCCLTTIEKTVVVRLFSPPSNGLSDNTQSFSSKLAGKRWLCGKGGGGLP